MASKSATDRAKKTALEKALRGMFGKLQNRPIPDRLMSIVDQLDAADQPPLKKSGT
jgi:Anti-sigma factor NepR